MVRFFPCIVGIAIAAGGCRYYAARSPRPQCAPQNIVAEQNVPNIYFVLDHSGSMNDHNKWTTMRSVVANIMTTLGTNARFGAAVFPAPNTNDCAPGAEVLPLQLGDSTGGLASTLLTATTDIPQGGTPTAATLENLLPKLQSFPGSTFVILATDGGANCNPALFCSIDQCTLNLDSAFQCVPFVPPNCCDPSISTGNCLDTQNTVDAVAALKAANVPTYVIGIEGSAPYEQMLDELAQAGGTARAAAPYYYRVDTSDAATLESVLTEVATKITGACTITLASAPASLKDVVVRQGGALVPEDPNNGWSISGTTLTLHGAACDARQSGRGLDLSVTEDCPNEVSP